MLESKPFLHLSTGNLLREAIQQKSPLGIEAQSYVDAGKLVPDSVVIGLVREFIEKNKGRIWLKSEPGKGSTFYVSLPAKQ